MADHLRSAAEAGAVDLRKTAVLSDKLQPGRSAGGLGPDIQNLTAPSGPSTNGTAQ